MRRVGSAVTSVEPCRARGWGRVVGSPTLGRLALKEGAEWFLHLRRVEVRQLGGGGEPPRSRVLSGFVLPRRFGLTPGFLPLPLGHVGRQLSGLFLTDRLDLRVHLRWLHLRPGGVPASAKELHLDAPVKAVPFGSLAGVAVRALRSLRTLAVREVIPAEKLASLGILGPVVHRPADLLTREGRAKELGGCLVAVLRLLAHPPRGDTRRRGRLSRLLPGACPLQRAPLPEGEAPASAVEHALLPREDIDLEVLCRVLQVERLREPEPWLAVPARRSGEEAEPVEARGFFLHLSPCLPVQHPQLFHEA